MMSQQYSPAGFSLLPPVVKNLLIINGLFFLATYSLESAFGIDLVRIMGLHYFQSDLFRPYQFVTYMFLHASFSHIFFNMFALWMFGYLIENVWGSRRFLTYYMVTGIGAAIIQMLVTWWDISSIQHAAYLYSQSPSLDGFIALLRHHFPLYLDDESAIKPFLNQWRSFPHAPGYIAQSIEFTNQLIGFRMDVPTLGASGSVYGILLAFGMLFPNMLVFIYFLFPIKAKWVVLIFGIIELVSGISSNPTDNVAHFAHLGGMIFGFFMILYWKKRTGGYYS